MMIMLLTATISTVVFLFLLYIFLLFFILSVTRYLRALTMYQLYYRCWRLIGVPLTGMGGTDDKQIKKQDSSKE